MGLASLGIYVHELYNFYDVDITAVIKKKSPQIDFYTITLDNNNISNDMQFSEDVKMDYLENTIFSDRANFNNYENQLLIAGNVRGDGPTTNLKADELDFDLNTKDLKISMYSEERVKIKTKF